VGKFGQGTVRSASGVVVHVHSKKISDETQVNHYGCEPFGNPIPKEPWIALIKRGQ